MYQYRSGVTERTTKNLMIGPGAIYRGFVGPDNFGDLIGATSGGNTVNLETEWHVAAIDGTLGPLKGARWLTAATAKLQSSLIEITKDTFQMKFPSMQATTLDADYTKLSHDGNIAPSWYDTVAIVGEITGKSKPIIFVLENAAVVDSTEIPLGTGKDDIVLKVEWEAHYDASAPTLIPFYILYPDSDVSPVAPPIIAP